MRDLRMMLADMVDIPAHTAAMDEELVITNGVNLPRYINPARGVAGFVGFHEWSNYWQKPQGADSGGAGSLDSEKYYSIKVVPVDTDRSYIATLVMAGPETLPSQPVTGATEIEFAIPVHPDNEVLFAGIAEETGIDDVVFPADSFDADGNIGCTLRNIESGEEYEITGNTTTTVTATGMEAVAGDRFHIERSACKRRYIYAAEFSSTSGILTATFHYQDYVDDNTTTTFTLSDYTASGVTTSDVIQPPTAATCELASNMMILAGGVRHDTGTAWVDITAQERTATADADMEITFSVVDDTYEDANSTKVIRATLGSSQAIFLGLRAGSFVTVAGASTSGNNVSEVRVLRADSDGEWIEYRNNDGVAEADEGVTLIAYPNVIHGTNTLFHDGCAGFSVRIGGSKLGSIVNVQPDDQTVTMDVLYSGPATSAVDKDELLMVSVNNIYYSEVGNPHNYTLASTIDVSGNVRRMVAYTNALLIFTDTELQVLPYDDFGEAGPQHVFGGVRINAPLGIAASHADGVLFWDGSGFSVTDGINSKSITSDKCRWLMDGINFEGVANIRAAWNSKEARWEVSFPYGNAATNNYGLYITADRRVYGIQRLDVNAIWSDIDDAGKPVMRHGSSGRYTTDGTIWTHSESLQADGVPEGGAALCMVEGYNAETRTITASSGRQVLSEAGTPVAIISHSITTFVMESIAETGTDPYTYEIVIPEDWASNGVEIGATLVIGAIPFVYGPRWKDFGSPQYRHQVRRTELDIEPTTGWFYGDHYLDLDEKTPVKTTPLFTTGQDSKLVFPFSGGKGYQYGFRLSGIAVDGVLIDGLSVLFDTIV